MSNFTAPGEYPNGRLQRTEVVYMVRRVPLPQKYKNGGISTRVEQTTEFEPTDEVRTLLGIVLLHGNGLLRHQRWRSVA